jgi:hypothetical protein
VVRVDADFRDEYPGGDATCTEAYASLCRTGEVAGEQQPEPLTGPRVRPARLDHRPRG